MRLRPKHKAGKIVRLFSKLVFGIIVKGRFLNIFSQCDRRMAAVARAFSSFTTSKIFSKRPADYLPSISPEVSRRETRANVPFLVQLVLSLCHDVDPVNLTLQPFFFCRRSHLQGKKIDLINWRV